MVFEEFAGQIPLQKMLKLLDPYPMALEVKGGMRPAMMYSRGHHEQHEA